jgi:hypothetical protein
VLAAPALIAGLDSRKSSTAGLTLRKVYIQEFVRAAANSIKKAGGHDASLTHSPVAALDISSVPVVTADNRGGNPRLVGDSIQVFPLGFVECESVVKRRGYRTSGQNPDWPLSFRILL